jgi:AcrR family transcriptional regulator
MAARTGSGRSQTREKVLDATVATLAAQGFSRTTARAVAAAGGFAPGVIYYHFESLDDLSSPLRGTPAQSAWPATGNGPPV